jgi:hypothetical protein
MSDFDVNAAIDQNFDADDERRYIDVVGTHYLTLVGYDYFDGSYDEKTKRGYKRSVGPLFLFECAGSEDIPMGETLSRMITLNRQASDRNPEKTGKIRKMVIAEARDVFAALLKSKDPTGAEEFTPEAMKAVMPNVDGVLSTFVGVTIRCDAREGKTPGFVNCKWYPDDRTDG